MKKLINPFVFLVLLVLLWLHRNDSTGILYVLTLAVLYYSNEILAILSDMKDDNQEKKE